MTLFKYQRELYLIMESPRFALLRDLAISSARMVAGETEEDGFPPNNFLASFEDWGDIAQAPKTTANPLKIGAYEPATLLYFDLGENDIPKGYGAEKPIVGRVGYILLIRDEHQPLIWAVQLTEPIAEANQIKVVAYAGSDTPWGHEEGYIYHKFYPESIISPLVKMEVLNWIGYEWKIKLLGMML